MANGDDAPGLDDTPGRPSLGAYAQVAALLHESRREAPDQLGAFLGRRVAVFGMRDLSVYVTDFEQRRLLPIAGSAATASIDMEASTGGRSFTTTRQVEEPVEGGVRLWSVVVDGAARLGVMCVTVSMVDQEGPGQSTENGAVGRGAPWPCYLPPQYGQLVAEHGDLHVLLVGRWAKA